MRIFVSIFRQRPVTQMLMPYLLTLLKKKKKKIIDNVLMFEVLPKESKKEKEFPTLRDAPRKVT